MKKIKLFPKIFLCIVTLMILVIIVAHGLIYFFMPNIYNWYQKELIKNDLDQLVEKLEESDEEGKISVVSQFAAKWKADISVNHSGFIYEIQLLGVESKRKEDGETENATIVAYKENDNIKIEVQKNTAENTDYFYITKTYDHGNIITFVSRERIEEAVKVSLIVLPITASISIFISIIFSLLLSHIIVKPIKEIDQKTKDMRSLKKGIVCKIDTDDEIGDLSSNIDILYQSFLTTISNLEEKIDLVSRAEEEKVDFLRAASHELKTPITAVSAMLENMILNFGCYQDRDKYLVKCKRLVDELTNMIRRILDSSEIRGRTDIVSETFNLSILINELIVPYQILANAKGIEFQEEIVNDVEITKKKELLIEALNNILSNAVLYTESEKSVRVFLSDTEARIENECIPIDEYHIKKIFSPFYRLEYDRNKNTGGNGLGLYIVNKTLDQLEIQYKFEPLEDNLGMVFIIKLNNLI